MSTLRKMQNFRIQFLRIHRFIRRVGLFPMIEVIRMWGPPEWKSTVQDFYYNTGWKTSYGLHVIGLEVVSGSVKSVWGNPLESERRQLAKFGIKITRVDNGKKAVYRPMPVSIWDKEALESGGET